MVLDRCSEKTFIAVSVLAVLFASVLAHRGSQSQSGNVSRRQVSSNEPALGENYVEKSFLPQDFPADTTFVDRVGVHSLTGSRARAVRETFEDKKGLQATYIIIAFSVMPLCDESSPSCRDSNFTILHETEQIFIVQQSIVSSSFFNNYCKYASSELLGFDLPTYIHYPIYKTYIENDPKYYFVFKCGEFIHDDFELLLTENAVSDIEAGRVFQKSISSDSNDDHQFIVKYYSGKGCPSPGDYFTYWDIAFILFCVALIIFVLGLFVPTLSILIHNKRLFQTTLRKSSKSRNQKPSVNQVRKDDDHESSMKHLYYNEAFYCPDEESESDSLLENSRK